MSFNLELFYSWEILFIRSKNTSSENKNKKDRNEHGDVSDEARLYTKTIMNDTLQYVGCRECINSIVCRRDLNHRQYKQLYFYFLIQNTVIPKQAKISLEDWISYMHKFSELLSYLSRALLPIMYMFQYLPRTRSIHIPYLHESTHVLLRIILQGILRMRDYTKNDPSIILSPSWNVAHSWGMKISFQPEDIRPRVGKIYLNPRGNTYHYFMSMVRQMHIN